MICINLDFVVVLREPSALAKLSAAAHRRYSNAYSKFITLSVLADKANIFPDISMLTSTVLVLAQPQSSTLLFVELNR